MSSSGLNTQPSGSALSSIAPIMSLTRRNTALSPGSESHASSVAGLVTLPLHGDCSRCHHHHSSARFRVNLFRNSNIMTNLVCERCKEKWLVMGGRNTTQLSLPSLKYTRPDSVANDVRPHLSKCFEGQCHSHCHQYSRGLPSCHHANNPCLAKLKSQPYQQQRRDANRITIKTRH